MKHIITILLIVALLIGGYLWLNNRDSNTIPNDQVTLEEETNQDQDTDEVDTNNPNDNNATSSEVSSNIEYCNDLKENIPASESFVIVTTVPEGALVSTGTEVGGCVYSVSGSYAGWAPFEGQIGYYQILASDNTLLAEGPLPTLGNWMELGLNNDPIRYQTTLEFDSQSYTNGTLVLHNENAAGLPEMDKQIEIGVTFQ